MTVKSLDLRPGGRLVYVMAAVEPDKIAFMKQSGMPTAHDALITYREITPHRRLAYTHVVDFVPGVGAYDVNTVVELHPVPAGVRMVLAIDRMHDDVWTQRAVAGWEQELGKLDKVLAR